VAEASPFFPGRCEKIGRRVGQALPLQIFSQLPEGGLKKSKAFPYGILRFSSRLLYRTVRTITLVPADCSRNGNEPVEFSRGGVSRCSDFYGW